MGRTCRTYEKEKEYIKILSPKSGEKRPFWEVRRRGRDK
jgi:hypothetical protein